MTIEEYMIDTLPGFIGRIFMLAILCLFLYLTGTELGILIIIAISYSLLCLVYYMFKYFHLKKRIEELYSILSDLDEKYLFSACVPRSRNIIEKQYFNILRIANKSMREKVANLEIHLDEHKEYIETWIHEIKAPITAIKLICNNNPSLQSSKTIIQAALIEQHVQRALYHSKLGCLENDIIVRPYLLKDMITNAIRDYREMLIGVNMKIETNNLDILVHTDAKMFEFVLGQILSNSIKYRSQIPVIKIFTIKEEDKTKLIVQDNGIGIQADELPRVLNKGFSGSNGRSLGGSTGMGLYISKKLLSHLNHTFRIQSEEHQYTSIEIGL